MTKVYLAGPMSGIAAFNIPAFDAAAARLREIGAEVISPAEVDGPVTRAQLLTSPDGDHKDLPQDESWSYYLARDFRILHDERPDAIVTLPGWEKSTGAGWEVYIGARLGIPRWDYDEHLGWTIPTYSVDTTRFGDVPDAALYDADGQFIRHEDNPLRQRSVTGGVKDNRGKPNVELLPTEPLIAVGRVLGFGARKYKPNNWRLGLSWLQTIGSALRHIFAFLGGEDIDPESGECHVDNAICQLMFLSTYYHTKTGTDDRWATLSAEQRQEAEA